MKRSSYNRPRYHIKCLICGKEFTRDSRIIPRHFDKTKARTPGLPELPCLGSGKRGIPA